MDVSVILPHYNNKELAEKSVRVLSGYLGGCGLSHEIVVVDDGSDPDQRPDMDRTGENIRLVQIEKNRGKGFAVRQGMLAAKGDCCIYTDIDLPYDLTAIPYAVALVRDGTDFVGGDRALFHSVDGVHRPLMRRFASRVFSKLVALLVIGGIIDSQCGFKAFSRRLVQALFPLLTIDRFSFDVEIYYLLLRYNISMKRIPVRLHHHDVSTVSVFRHFMDMTMGVFSIPLKWHSGRYASERMRDFYPQDRYWEAKA
ncbi:MAG: glycosyltransferase [Elusimicrobia bacterium]|nr:glycosyltransferase [Elusimicrobiota bacterium]